jgi:hypothetical protein
VIAAPFVWMFGTRGLLVTNALALAIALALAYRELRRTASPDRALLASSALMLATVLPVYLVWPTPEMVTVALIMGGLSAWRSNRPLLAAVLLGIATYTKPYNLFLALPLGVEPLLALRPWWKGLAESARRGAVMAAVVIGLFGVNAAITGELNYQGGERKTFYGRFPFEMDGQREITFGNSGIWMTTNQPGPLVEGRDDHLVTRQTGPARPAGEVEASFARNLYYFWIPYDCFFRHSSVKTARSLSMVSSGGRDMKGWTVAWSPGRSECWMGDAHIGQRNTADTTAPATASTISRPRGSIRTASGMRFRK